MDGETLGLRLRVLRARKGATLADVAESTGLRYETVSELERDMRRPRIGTLHRLGAYYGVDPAQLMHPEPEPDTPLTDAPETETEAVAGKGSTPPQVGADEPKEDALTWSEILRDRGIEPVWRESTGDAYALNPSGWKHLQQRTGISDRTAAALRSMQGLLADAARGDVDEPEAAARIEALTRRFTNAGPTAGAAH